MPETFEYLMPGQGSKEELEAAANFLKACGLEPTDDAIHQLAVAFLPALIIMCERGYHPGGETWRQKGWRGLVQDILNKAGRLRYHSWLNNNFDKDSAIDIINFAGFYVRLANQGPPWGEWGEPGSNSYE